jgi:hypothetical protein
MGIVVGLIGSVTFAVHTKEDALVLIAGSGTQ